MKPKRNNCYPYLPTFTVGCKVFHFSSKNSAYITKKWKFQTGLTGYDPILSKDLIETKKNTDIEMRL